jgi:hypothetical protein
MRLTGEILARGGGDTFAIDHLTNNHDALAFGLIVDQDVKVVFGHQSIVKKRADGL